MKCPACGGDCVSAAHEVLETIGSIFSPCPDCHYRLLDKRAPLPNRFYEPPCGCGRRFIDEVFAHIYVIMLEEGLLSGTEPLFTAGTPLIHPGFFMKEPPHLPSSSLVLLSGIIDRNVAVRLLKEVPEIKGVVKKSDYAPGIADLSLEKKPRSYELLSGCDVRANIFPTSAGPIVLYQQQSLIHIEFPRAYNPKIEAVESKLRSPHPDWFIDAASGAGTLGLTAARLGVPHVVLNDAWYAGAFWSAFNIDINKEFFMIDAVSMSLSYDEMKAAPVRVQPVIIARTTGRQSIEVYQGDLRELWHILPGAPVLTVLDLFDKEDKELMSRAMALWREHVSGEVFIP